ncbi:F0F1 ATP synthase subunit A [Candidatus Peregrinibacteria bacterium]|nr:F0F1 ATP synthase subunit A [Candidatus Peregrinibacteria bacterium]
MGILIILAVIGGRRVREVPSGIQNVMEAFLGGLQSVIESILGNAKQAKEFFAIVATIFIFVLFSNWFGLIPGVGSIGFFEKETAKEEMIETAVTEDHAAKSAVEEDHKAEEGGHHITFVPLFRASSSDLSFTLAIAICAVLYVQYAGLKHLRFHYLGKFFNFKSVIFFFVGILEIISEFAKMISFSFRLFGNVFAGEVLLVVMTFLVPYIIPIPFYGLEVFVGAVQAGVFAALTLVFLKGATTHH